MDDSEISLTKVGKRRKASFSTVCEWILKAWHDIPPKVIKNGFAKAEIHTYVEEIDKEGENLIGSSSYEESVGITDELEELLLADSDSDNDVLDENGDEFDGFE